jgi:hypothetical protein
MLAAMTLIPSAAEAYYRQLSALVTLRPRILKLCAAVRRPADLYPFQWAQLMATVLEFQPDLILELGRGYGNSTCVFTEAAHHLNQEPACRVLSLCRSDDWRVCTRARLQTVVPPEWFLPLSSFETDICAFDFEAALASARRVLVFWDAHGFKVAEVVLGKILPNVATKPHLIIMHDMCDARYLPEDSRLYGENPLWTGNNWSGPRVQLGHIVSTVEQAIAAIDFTSRNRVALHSADHDLHTGLSDDQNQELKHSLCELYSLDAFWFYFSLTESEPPFTFPRFVSVAEAAVSATQDVPSAAASKPDSKNWLGRTTARWKRSLAKRL